MKRLSRFSKEEVSKILKKARRAVRHPGLDILVYASKPPEKQNQKTGLPEVAQRAKTGRILVITPKRIGSSPQRNKIRRQLKSIFYEEKLFEKNLDLIVIVKKKGVDLTFDQLKKLLLQAFEKQS